MVVTSPLKNTDGREDGRLSGIRRQKAVFPTARGGGAFRRPASIVRVLRAEPWAFPTERAGSEEDYKCRLRRQRCLWQRKPSQPGFARWKCTPFGAVHHLSPKGKHVTGFSGRSAPLRIQFLCHPGGGTLLAAQLLLSQAVQSIASLKSPPPGEMSPQATEGMHFHAPQARLFGFAAERHIKLHRREAAIPQPFEPACQGQAEPSEPSEPGPRSGSTGDATTL